MTTNRYRIAVWRGGWLVYDKDFSNEYPSAHGFASRSEAEQWIDKRRIRRTDHDRSAPTQDIDPLD